MTRCCRIVLVGAFCVVGLNGGGQEKPRSHTTEEKPAAAGGSGVGVTATLKSSRFSFGQVSGPAFDVEMVVTNPTAAELELGESLVVIEKEQGSDAFASSYVARERSRAQPAQPADPFAALLQGGGPGAASSVRRRYQLDWGEDIDKDGSALMLFVGGGQFAVSFSHPGAYEGLGWGSVSPRAERTIAVQVPFPYRVKGKRDYLALVLPWVRSREPGAPPASVTILKFEPDDPKPPAAFRLIESSAVSLNAAELRALATNPGFETWRRVFALNWLAETAPKESTGLLVETLASAETPQLLRAAAGYDLAMLRAREGVPPLLAALAAAQEDRIRGWAIECLGEIGDVQAAPAIRAYFGSKDDNLARGAMEAAGKLKDSESVAPLLAVLADKARKDRHDAAAGALAAIGDPAAIGGLLGMLADPRNDNRALAAEKLGRSGASEAVPALAVVASDRTAKNELKGKALASLGSLGGAPALAAVRAAAEDPGEPVRTAALGALRAMKDSAGVPALIELAGKSGYASRDKAVSELAQANTTEALPVLRALVADKQAPSMARREACRALHGMQDALGIPALQSALDDFDKDVYEEALTALVGLAAKDVDQAALHALKSAHPNVRRRAADRVGQAKPEGAAAALWEAYQAEKDEEAGSRISQALVAVAFEDQAAVPFLVGRLNPKANKLWYSDVVLLRQVTKQSFGPEFKYVGDKQRDAELAKWRSWAASGR